MARVEERTAIEALTPYLQPGEQLRHVAFGVKQPHILLIAGLAALALLPGLIAVALLTKEYIVGLTDRRLLVLRFSGKKINVKEITEYALPEIAGRVKASKGAIFTKIRVLDAKKPFAAKFHRLGMKDDKSQSSAVADLLAPRVA